MTAATRCGRCARPTDGYVCSSCVRQLVRTLESVPWLVEQLATAAYGPRKFSDPAPRRRVGPTETALPWDERAVRAARHLHAVLLRGARLVAADTEAGAPPADLARLIRRRLTDLARHAESADLVDDLGAAVDRGIDALNRRDPGVFLGPCPAVVVAEDGTDADCREPLYARRGADGQPAPTVSCWRCRTVHDTDELRQRAWETAEAMLFSGAEILRVMRDLGEPIPRSRFYSWRREGRLQPRGWQLGDGRIVQYETAGARPVFSLAEVRALAAEVDRPP